MFASRAINLPGSQAALNSHAIETYMTTPTPLKDETGSNSQQLLSPSAGQSRFRKANELSPAGAATATAMKATSISVVMRATLGTVTFEC